MTDALAGLAFDNSYARDLEGAYVAWQAAPAPAPAMVKLNRPRGAGLCLDADALDGEAGARSLARNPDSRNLPEVPALRAVSADEVRPVLALLSDPRPEVQCAVLSALEYRPVWFVGEAELVLKVVAASHEPAVRAAAAYALATSDNAEVLAGLAALLRDPMPEGRGAASDALWWNAAGNWQFVRDAVRAALAEPLLADDGPLFSTGRLPAAAIADLITWSEDHAPLAQRAMQTLVEQYSTEGEQGIDDLLARCIRQDNGLPHTFRGQYLPGPGIKHL